MIRHAARFATLLPLVAALDCAWRGAGWAEASCGLDVAKERAGKEENDVENLSLVLQIFL